ncbi:Ociad1.2 family protein [Megaselia abdita]
MADRTKSHSSYHYSAEELKALEECSIESFFQRSLPLATILAVGAHIAVKQGYLKPNTKFGSAPKVVFGLILGYLIGQISYQNKCAQKFMEIPDSEIGELLRRTRKR